MTHKIPKQLQQRNTELNKLTVESITQALILLLNDNEYEKISITDICTKAGVSRNAFYHNFKTKEGVLKAIVFDFNKNVILRKLGNPFNKRTDETWYVNFFLTIKEYSSLFYLLQKADLNNFYLNYVNELLTQSTQCDAMTKYRRLIWNGAIQNAALAWVRGGMVESPEEIASVCFERLNPCTKDREMDP